MINVILADDEPIIRNGMIHIIDWESLGYHLAEAAKDGMEALDYIEQSNIQVLVSDIRMPFLDGLELIKIVKELHPEIYCILLTSYADFNYAKKAIELGIYSYLLKPVNVDELTHTLGNLKEEIEKIDMHKKYVSNLESYIRQLDADHHRETVQLSGTASADLGEKFILRHYCDKDFSLTKAAQSVGFEATYYSKLFKQRYKIGFSDYIISLRIEKAKRLFATTLYTSSAVCDLIGYENYSYFSTLFKKKVGISPSKYLESLDGTESKRDCPLCSPFSENSDNSP